MGSIFGRGSGKDAARAAILFAFLTALVSPALALDKKEYRVHIVVDILKPKFQDIIDGFRQTLDAQLAAEGAKASYTVFDTKTDPAKVPGILEAIRAGRPDLVCAINSPDSFADKSISLKLADPAYRIVSENCIPIQSGVAKEWKRPGGNITGVGVFVQMNSLIKMAKMVNPKYRKLIFLSWDRTTEINDWFVTELKEACRQEGIELAEVRYLSSTEDEFEALRQCDLKGSEYFGIIGISAWTRRDGSLADLLVEEPRFFRSSIKHFPIYVYDETAVQVEAPAGVCVVWHDIGVQLGEKGMKVLQGARPGDIPWDYPRKYNIMLNLAAAKSIGLTLPRTLIDAAYRVYTDYEGNFMGSKN
jgi:putative tryptophan/tyrosine transport system substrate-binding protein